MMLNLNKKKFVSLQNTENGEVSSDTIFNYFQEGNIVWAEYSGGAIKKGSLIALMAEDGSLSMKYHHINFKNEIMAGDCFSVPEILSDGRIKIHEQWRWTSGDLSSGNSVIIELKE